MTTTLVPKHATSLAVSGAAIISATAIGSSADAGLQRAVAEHELQVLAHEEQGAEHGEEHERDRDRRGA